MICHKVKFSFFHFSDIDDLPEEHQVKNVQIETIFLCSPIEQMTVQLGLEDLS